MELSTKCAGERYEYNIHLACGIVGYDSHIVNKVRLNNYKCSIMNMVGFLHCKKMVK